MSEKKPQISLITMNELVLPNDTNTLNNLMGGRLLHWMDIAAAIAAQKHAQKIVVTASVDSVSFGKSIKLFFGASSCFFMPASLIPFPSGMLTPNFTP